MTLRFLISLLLVAALLAGVLLHAEEASCHASARECAQQIRQLLAGRRYLGVQLGELKPGLFIKTVLPDSPAHRAGLLPGDRLIAVNGQSLSEANRRRFKQLLANASNTGRFWIIVQREGAFRKVEGRLEPYPSEYIEKAISVHLSQGHTATAGAQP